jgi:hypothetical protein
MFFGRPNVAADQGDDVQIKIHLRICASDGEIKILLIDGTVVKYGDTQFGCSNTLDGSDGPYRVRGKRVVTRSFGGLYQMEEHYYQKLKAVLQN